MTDPNTADVSNETDIDVQESHIPARLNSYGREVWLEITPALRAAGRLKMTDLPAITRYCDLAGTYWKMSEEIERDGVTYWASKIVNRPDSDDKEVTVQTEDRMLRRNPLVADRQRIASELRLLENMFGMSPLSRANLLARKLGRGSGDLFPADDPDVETPSHSHGDSPDNFMRRH